MQHGAQKYALAWYQPQSWTDLKATAADADDLEDTYHEWRANAESTFKKLRRQGMRLEKVVIDIEALLAWCATQGHIPDANARSLYAAHLLRQREQNQSRTPPEVETKKKRKTPDAKGLSPKAEEAAMMAEQLYREQRLPVDEITHLLQISKSTFYRYLQYRGVQIEGRQR